MEIIIRFYNNVNVLVCTYISFVVILVASCNCFLEHFLLRIILMSFDKVLFVFSKSTTCALCVIGILYMISMYTDLLISFCFNA